AGVGVGTVAAEIAARRRIRSVAAVVLTLQTALIAAFMLYDGVRLGGERVADHSSDDFYVLASLAVVSMGMQTSALRQLAGRSVSTTYVTGVLTSLTKEPTITAFRLL